jgi:hypothetical protein
MTQQPCMSITWENENGVMVASVGWVIEDEGDEIVLAGGLEHVTQGEVVPLAVQHIPKANIHLQIQIGVRTTPA